MVFKNNHPQIAIGAATDFTNRNEMKSLKMTHHRAVWYRRMFFMATDQINVDIPYINLRVNLVDHIIECRKYVLNTLSFIIYLW